MKFQRVHILGGAGSGKSTLASAYAKQSGIPHHELDNFYYLTPAARTRRTATDRDQRLASVIDASEWVVEGIFWQPWVRPSLVRADKIVVLAIPEMTRHVRVVKRHFQLLKRAGLKDLPRFFPTLIELLQHNRTYAEGPLIETLELVQQLGESEEKVSVCDSNAMAMRELGLA